MMNWISPRSASIAALLARKTLKNAVDAVSVGVLLGNGTLLLCAVMALCSFAGQALFQMWIDPDRGVWALTVGQSKALSFVGIGALALWASVEFCRSPWLTSRLSWSQPLRSLFVMASSGTFLMMDRVSQVFVDPNAAAVPLGVAKAMRFPSREATPASALAGRPWRSLFDPAVIEARFAIGLWRFAPLAVGSLLWGVASMSMAVLVMPFAAIELIALRAISSFKGGLIAGLHARAKQKIDAWADESAQDLAAVEAKTLERSARGAEASASAQGPRRL